jgi:Spy/CpxP family protein refolding chaperone
MRGKWIKSTVLMLGMGVAGAGVWAQQASQSATSQTPEASAQSASPSTAEGLQLSQAQKKQLHELRLAARDQAAVIRNDQKLTAEEKMVKLKELRANTREQMKSVLTPEQQSAWAARRDARQAEVAAKLGLTADQQSKLKDLFRSTHEQRQSVLTSTSLSDEQKMTQLKQIRETAKAQLATILTPDQLQKFREMRKEHHMHKQG